MFPKSGPTPLGLSHACVKWKGWAGGSPVPPVALTSSDLMTSEWSGMMKTKRPRKSRRMEAPRYILSPWISFLVLECAWATSWSYTIKIWLRRFPLFSTSHPEILKMPLLTFSKEYNWPHMQLVFLASLVSSCSDQERGDAWLKSPFYVDVMQFFPESLFFILMIVHIFNNTVLHRSWVLFFSHFTEGLETYGLSINIHTIAQSTLPPE